MTGIDRAVSKLGSQAALAQACSVTQPAVSRWVTRGWAPSRHWRRIATATGVGVDRLALDMARATRGVEA